jgi:hypothetical protein
MEDDEDEDQADDEPPGLGPDDTMATRRVPAHKWVSAALFRCVRQAGRLPGWGQQGGGGRGRQPEPGKHDAATWAAQAMTMMVEMLAALPMTLEAGGGASVERCGLLVAGGAAAVEETGLPQGLRELVRFLKFRADAGLDLLLPRCIDDAGNVGGAGGNYDDEDG